MAQGRLGWADQVVWWQAYPLGIVGAEKTLDEVEGVAHRLPRLEAWLDHLISLGANGLLLGPVFASATHGYDTVDYLRIDPRLGDDADFDALVAACRQRGVRLLLDGVFNHAGRDFPPVAQALHEGPGSEAADWVSALYDNGGLITADYFEGHDTLITLNHSSARVQAYVREVMLHWLRRGIDGWRLDAAYAVPSDFWSAVLPQVREEFADAWFVGEMIHGDYVAYVERSGLDSITEYELWKAIWSSLDSTQPPRARLDVAAPRRLRRTLRADDLPLQPRRHPGRQPRPRPAAPVARGGAARLPARGAERLLRRRVRARGRQAGPTRW